MLLGSAPLYGQVAPPRLPPHGALPRPDPAPRGNKGSLVRKVPHDTQGLRMRVTSRERLRPQLEESVTHNQGRGLRHGGGSRHSGRRGPGGSRWETPTGPNPLPPSPPFPRGPSREPPVPSASLPLGDMRPRAGRAVQAALAEPSCPRPRPKVSKVTDRGCRPRPWLQSTADAAVTWVMGGCCPLGVLRLEALKGQERGPLRCSRLSRQAGLPRPLLPARSLCPGARCPRCPSLRASGSAPSPRNGHRAPQTTQTARPEGVVTRRSPCWG